MTPHKEPPSTDGRVLRARALREERRIQIIEAARGVFADKGYHAGSINDIIEAASIARGTFYLHFESKRAVLEEILDGFLRDLQVMVKRVDVTSSVSPQDQLQDNVEQVLARLIRNPDLTRILLREAVGLDEEFDQKLHDFYDRVLAMIRRSLVTGMRIGLVRQVDIEIVGCSILGSVKEVINHLVLNDSGEPPDPKTLAASILHYNLRGVLA